MRLCVHSPCVPIKDSCKHLRVSTQRIEGLKHHRHRVVFSVLCFSACACLLSQFRTKPLSPASFLFQSTPPTSPQTKARRSAYISPLHDAPERVSFQAAMRACGSRQKKLKHSLNHFKKHHSSGSSSESSPRSAHVALFGLILPSPPSNPSFPSPPTIQGASISRFSNCACRV